MVWVMRVWAAFERLIPHLSACCAFGLDGEEVAGRGVVFQAPGFHTSAVQVNRPYYGEAAGVCRNPTICARRIDIADLKDDYCANLDRKS